MCGSNSLVMHACAGVLMVVVSGSVNGQAPTLELQTGVVECLAFRPGTNELATVTHNGEITLWDLATGERSNAFRGESWAMSMAISPDGRLLAQGGYRAGINPKGDAVRIWDIAKGVERGKLQGHYSGVRALAFSPNGRFLAVGAQFQLRIWNVKTGREVQKILFKGSVSVLAFSPNGKALATAGSLWSVATGEQLLRWEAPELCETIAFSPNGRRIVSAGDSKICFSDARTGKTVRQIEVGQSRLESQFLDITSLVFFPGGKRFASGGNDGKVIVWSTSEGKRLGELSGVKDDGRRGKTLVALSSDGGTLASGGRLSESVFVWDLRRARTHNDPPNVKVVKPMAETQLWRRWIDSTGKYSVEAKVEAFRDGKVSLTKRNGKQVSLTIGELSKEDQQYVRSVHEMKLESRNE